MEKDLGSYRKSYEYGELLLDNTPENPLQLFESWFTEVDQRFQDTETNAMTISTIGKDGFPKSRIVLLKKYNDKGFIFYTNYKSEKGRAIKENSKVCLSFFWEKAERQVIIKGEVFKISEAESDAYFKSRPKGSQLGAVVSHQSEPIASRVLLETQLKQLEKEYEIKPVERPDVWGGYIVKPVSIEFWQGRPNRLHDRILYQSVEKNWSKIRLQP
jgi:pyridoxamine 5'-phosphate oxidase